MSTGDERRRYELINPESSLTAMEIYARKDFAFIILKVGIGISMMFMILSSILIAYLSTRYMGITGFKIAFFGTLINVSCGALIAYNFGNKIQRNYIKEIKT